MFLTRSSLGLELHSSSVVAGREHTNSGGEFSGKKHEQVREGKLHFPYLQRDFAVSPGHLIPCSATLPLIVPISSIDPRNN